jgi:hypothetical protein
VRRKGVDAQDFTFNYCMSLRQFGQATDALFKCLEVPLKCTLDATACSAQWSDILSSFETAQVRACMPDDHTRVEYLLTQFLVPVLTELERRRTLLVEYLLDASGTAIKPAGNADGFFPLQDFLNPITGKDLVQGLWHKLAAVGYMHPSLATNTAFMAMQFPQRAHLMASPLQGAQDDTAFTSTMPPPVAGQLWSSVTGPQGLPNSNPSTAVSFGSTVTIPAARTAATPTLQLTGLGLTPSQCSRIQELHAAWPAPNDDGRGDGRHLIDSVRRASMEREDTRDERGTKRQSRGAAERAERKRSSNARSPPRSRPRRQRSTTPPPRGGGGGSGGKRTPAERPGAWKPRTAQEGRIQRHATRNDYNRSYLRFAEKLLSKHDNFKGVECPDEAQLKSGKCSCAECHHSWGFLHGKECNKASMLRHSELRDHNKLFTRGENKMPGHYQEKDTREAVLPK